MAAAANEIERGNAVVIAGNRLAINDAGARAQACQRLDDQREATGEVIARTPHLRAGLASNDAEAVMFDFMQPLAAGRQLVGFGWEARRDEPGRQGTLHRRCPTLFTRDSPDESQTGINVRVFPALLQDRREVLTATSTSDNPNAWSRV